MQEFVKKLIERLEGESYLTTNDDGETNKFSVQVVEWKDIKKIINQLAEEYNNDFCEWKQEDEEGFSNCRFNYQEIISDEVSGFVYCPYCGKKIKIAPYQPKGE